MKFNQSLKFNSVPEYQGYYLDYDRLKKIIYLLQKKQIENGEFKVKDDSIFAILDTQDTPATINSKSSAVFHEKRLRRRRDSERDNSSDSDFEVNLLKLAPTKLDDKKTLNPLLEFTKEFIDEINKISQFYKDKLDEIEREYNELARDLLNYNQQIFSFIEIQRENKISRTTTSNPIEIEEEEELDSSDDEEHDSNILVSKKHMRLQNIINLRQRCKMTWIKLNELKSFIELNKIGTTKIFKKFDKNLGYHIKDQLGEFLDLTVLNSLEVSSIDAKLNRILNGYVCTSIKLDNSQNVDATIAELNSYLKDHIIWERNSVWKDLINLEKQDFSINSNDLLNLDFEVYRIGKFLVKLPKFVFSWQTFKVLLAVVVFIILLTVKTFNDRAQGRCLALLAGCAILWATEALPLHTTAMLIPLLIVSCRILKNNDGSLMEHTDAAAYILSVMWNSVILILIGGFALASALSKYNIAKIISSWILGAVGTNPHYILLTVMLISLFLAMWISNVATPILCYSLIQPILKTMPTHSPFAKALVLGIALSSNMAGMASPIASPQNVIAIQAMNPNPGWGKWFAVALPVSILGTIGIWLELILTFDIKSSKIKPFQPIKDRWTVKQIFILVVTVATILLWCFETDLELPFGASGIIAIIPIVIFFGVGLLKTNDLNNFPWSIVLLAMGGQALGQGVKSSGLLKTVAEALQRRIDHFNVWIILIIFGVLVLVIATFVSHTVAALIVVPLVKEVGDSLPSNHSNLLIMGTVLVASGAMGLPTSGFPNVTAISMTDELGVRYLSVGTFINRGVPASIIAYVVIILLGYGIMSSLGF